MQNVPDFFHQARGFFFAGPAWLGCLATPSIQVKLIDVMRLTSNSLPRSIILIQDAACVKSKLIVFSFLEKARFQ